MDARLGQSRRANYTSIRALLICWKDSTQPEFEDQLQSLNAVLAGDYAFDVEKFEIESERPQQKLSARLLDFLQNDRDGGLLIVYYGGHGLNSRDKDCLWLCHDPATVQFDRNPRVNWSALQSLFINECRSHVLFLLDCCFAASSVQYTDATNTVEAIVASGFEGVAPLRGEHSFTTFLALELGDCRAKRQAIYANRLTSLVAARLNQTEWVEAGRRSRRSTPHHLVFSNSGESILVSAHDRPAVLPRAPFRVPLVSSTGETRGAFDIDHTSSLHPTVARFVHIVIILQ
jgi:hypothetical protein